MAQAVAPALSETPEAGLAGRASIINGDTIEVEGVIVRLHGIDAPEPGQRCGKPDGGSWPCGGRASEVLTAMAEDRDVECIAVENGTGHQVHGICRVGESILNERMVAEGYAWAVPSNTEEYAAIEAVARSAKLGVWQGPAVPPWEYRAERWAAAVNATSDGCPIKGILARGERVYHTPWSPWYDRVKVNESRGERWFCSEDAAVEAGWRAPRSR